MCFITLTTSYRAVNTELGCRRGGDLGTGRQCEKPVVGVPCIHRSVFFCVCMHTYVHILQLQVNCQGIVSFLMVQHADHSVLHELRRESILK